MSDTRLVTGGAVLMASALIGYYLWRRRASGGELVVIPPDEDAYISTINPDSPMGSSGYDPENLFICGQKMSDGSQWISKSLLKFTLPTMSSRATLNLYCTNDSVAGGTRVLIGTAPKNWYETTVTWNKFVAEVGVTTPIDEVSPQGFMWWSIPIDPRRFDQGDNTIVIALWLNTLSETGVMNQAKFRSKEGSVDNRPYLEVWV